MIPWGFHTLTWRYTKLNIIPFTEFMEAEIESITIRGRHSNRLTQCFPCNLGYSEKGSSKCELCPENTYFYISGDVNAYYCADCPAQTFAPRGSVGEQSCKQRRPCDEGDLDLHYSKCSNGMRTLSYEWADIDGNGEPDCEPEHGLSTIRNLPEIENISCEQCKKGMSRDDHGNCEYCPMGKF